MIEHGFTVRGEWRGGRLGKGAMVGDGLSAVISIPTSLDGPGLGSNPEELLLSASQGCYLITLSVILENRKIAVEAIEITSEGFVTWEGGLHFTRIIHRPRIVLKAEAADRAEETRQAAIETENQCMISRAMRGNVPVSIENIVVTA
ncbi:MAG: OsmC family protein [Proteobacteria bacterium]|nr:OsmC family protein [Pseudomonadota bacterium]